LFLAACLKPARPWGLVVFTSKKAGFAYPFLRYRPAKIGGYFLPTPSIIGLKFMFSVRQKVKIYLLPGYIAKKQAKHHGRTGFALRWVTRF
jgi:hypothetical protein